MGKRDKKDRKEKKDKKGKQPNGTKTLAQQADKFDLYQRSVQVPDAEVRFFDRAFRHAYGHRPAALREDFCGTAQVCCEWVRSHRERKAQGYDIDAATLGWAAEHNVAALDPKQRGRVSLREQDVREVRGPKADVIAAQNFSFFTFQTREALRGYFQSARSNLRDKGILVLDVMGGPQVLEEDRRETSKHKGFRYVWEQSRFDPITHNCKFHIHFKFKDGSRIDRAFTYDWRLWSIPELREVLAEAGFARSDVYWEDADGDSGEGNGVYRRRDHAASDPAWIAYVVGVK